MAVAHDQVVFKNPISAGELRPRWLLGLDLPERFPIDDHAASIEAYALILANLGRLKFPATETR